MEAADSHKQMDENPKPRHPGYDICYFVVQFLVGSLTSKSFSAPWAPLLAVCRAAVVLGTSVEWEVGGGRRASDALA